MMSKTATGLNSLLKKYKSTNIICFCILSMVNYAKRVFWLILCFCLFLLFRWPGNFHLHYTLRVCFWIGLSSFASGPAMPATTDYITTKYERWVDFSENSNLNSVLAHSLLVHFSIFPLVTCHSDVNYIESYTSSL